MDFLFFPLPRATFLVLVPWSILGKYFGSRLPSKGTGCSRKEASNFDSVKPGLKCRICYWQYNEHLWLPGSRLENLNKQGPFGKDRSTGKEKGKHSKLNVCGNEHSKDFNSVQI